MFFNAKFYNITSFSHLMVIIMSFIMNSIFTHHITRCDNLIDIADTQKENYLISE